MSANLIKQVRQGRQPYGDELRKQLVQDQHKLERMVTKLIDMAISGDIRAQQLIITRLDGNMPVIVAAPNNPLEYLERVDISKEELTAKLKLIN